MCYSCEYLSKLNLSSFNTNNVTDMSYIFSSCSNLNELLINKLNIKKIKKEIDVFTFNI